MSELKVMSVDDSKTVRMMIRNVLTRLPSTKGKEIEFFEAENGKEGIEILEENPDIQIILLDWNMPVMRGDEFLVNVRGRAEFNKTRIVMVTTEGERDKVKEMVKKGVNGYVVKPFNPAILEKSLAPIIKRL